MKKLIDILMLNYLCEINTTWSQSLILCHTARSVYEYFTWNLHVYVLYKYYILIKYYYM